MTDEMKKAIEDFGTPGLTRINAPKWGYVRAGFLSVDGVTHARGSVEGWRPVYACLYCGGIVAIVSNGKLASAFGSKSPLIIHAVHCMGITFGIRYVMAVKPNQGVETSVEAEEPKRFPWEDPEKPEAADGKEG